MATPTDIAASLTMDDIPVKLRCAACNKLANNAFRMPCCDQSICEDCQASLPEACPVCLHEPVKADDCRPNKALRTTIKAFLKKKLVDRAEAEKKRMLKEKTASTPAIAATPLPEETKHHQTPQIQIPAPSDEKPSAASHAEQESPQASKDPQESKDVAPAAEQAIPTEAQKDVPQLSIESPGPEIPRRASTQTAGDTSLTQEKDGEGGKDMDQQQAMAQSQQQGANNELAQGMNNDAFGFDGTNGNFPNMGLNGVGDFNQMMPMMQNGMMNNMMGSFPNMMGMPGMGMDPMAMNAAMYGGYGGQGMGMNGMNMNMGFDAGQGAFGGFNGQQTAWNAGQNKYNQNSYGAGHAGMGGGDYGANSGYGGYNMPPHQGNFNQVHHHQYPNNDFHQGHHGQGFQYRGRGRGRGYPNTGRGRGAYHQYNQYNHAQQGNQTNQEQYQPEITRRGSPTYGETQDQPERPSKADDEQTTKAEDIANSITAEEQLNKELAPGDAEDDAETKAAEPPKEAENATETTDGKVSEQTDVDPAVKKEVEKEEKPAPIETYTSDEPPKRDAALVESAAPIPSAMLPPPSPIAPTGPAAFRAADPSLDISPRGRGFSRGPHRGFEPRGGSYGRGSFAPNSNINHAYPAPLAAKPIAPPTAPKGLGVEGAPTGPKALREGQPNTGVRGFSIVGRASAAAQARPGATSGPKSPSREGSRSRSPSRHQSSHHRHHRHRSSSPSSSTDRAKKRERRHRHSRRHHDDSDSDDRRERKVSRSRDTSVGSDKKRSSHRSRREHNKDYKDTERSSHRSHRSHRDRSRGEERDRDTDDRLSKRRKESSPELTINGASGRIKGARHTLQSEAPPSSRKRRSDDDDEDYSSQREQKRKRRGQEVALEDENNTNRHSSHRSSRPSKHDPPSNPKSSARQNNHSHPSDTTTPRDPPTTKERPKSPPKGPKIDPHQTEREKYAQERIARENQRRLSQMGPAVKGGGKLGKGGVGRRVSLKYEDDETIRRGEMEREALRNR